MRALTATIAAAVHADVPRSLAQQLQAQLVMPILARLDACARRHTNAAVRL